MTVSRPEDPILQDLIHRIVEVADPDRIILFGSWAKGCNRDASDIDVLVVKHQADRRDTKARIYRNLIGLGRAVDVIVVRPEDIERYGDSPSLVLYDALHEGKEIYAA